MGLLQLKGRKLLIVFRRNTTVGADAKNMLVSMQDTPVQEKPAEEKPSQRNTEQERTDIKNADEQIEKNKQIRRSPPSIAESLSTMAAIMKA